MTKMRRHQSAMTRAVCDSHKDANRKRALRTAISPTPSTPCHPPPLAPVLGGEGSSSPLAPVLGGEGSSSPLAPVLGGEGLGERGRRGCSTGPAPSPPSTGARGAVRFAVGASYLLSLALRNIRAISAPHYNESMEFPSGQERNRGE